jgi:hypothetical protein
MHMKPSIRLPVLALALATAFGIPASAQLATPLPPSTVSYLNPGRYLIFQGSYVDDQGDAETGLMKFDTQTGLAWLLRPVPGGKPGDVVEYRWMPVKN